MEYSCYVTQCLMGHQIHCVDLRLEYTTKFDIPFLNRFNTTFLANSFSPSFSSPFPLCDATFYPYNLKPDQIAIPLYSLPLSPIISLTPDAEVLSL